MKRKRRSDMLTIDPKETPVPKLHQYLLGSVAPRPIAFASTLNETGVSNLAPFSFFNVFSANPPIAIFSPARRGRDNTTKHTFENVKQIAECVINVVNYDLLHQMNLASTEYPDGVSEFVKAGLTPLASEKVKPFRVAESPIQMECVVKQVIELGADGGAGNLIVCEVVLMHINENILDDEGRISPMKLDQVARMGGHYYTRANKGLFELPQPVKIGMGVDMLPADIRNSKILTGNNLGQLGMIESLPDETMVNEYKLTELADLFIQHEKNKTVLEQKLHEQAKALLDTGNVQDAWKTLLAFND
ncbi:MAG: flavin reductase family protein [Flavobacteriales bacterium]|nr:flavin reductase family protein [Flavobacteriales bacterium]